jgi:UDP-N-acetylmuramate--alanine ligase
MHIYFSGIGGAGIGPLALIAHQAGYEVSGSDSQQSQYTSYLEKNGVKLHIGQTKSQIEEEHAKNPIDWIVFSSAVFIVNPDSPELLFARENNIKISKRDEFLNQIISQKNLKLIAIAGTHGKTTTTSLVVWLFNQLKIPASYSVGAKLSFGPMGKYDKNSSYFIYECDEFDRNFLSFGPHLSIITVIDWDHHDIYPTKELYKQAFKQFIGQSKKTYILKRDNDYLDLPGGDNIQVVNQDDQIINSIVLPGLHNRQNALIAVKAIAEELGINTREAINIANKFPGSSRRFERIADNIYTDYAHTPEEIQATIQLAREISDNVVVAYEPLTDRRQHYMKDLYNGVFERAKKVYWLPSYLAREDPNIPVLTPEELIMSLNDKTKATPANKNDKLKYSLMEHAKNGDLVICMAGGGGHSLDEWARQNLIL